MFEDGQDINAGSLVVTGDLSANNGLTVTGGPITFPDGTTQTTALGASVKSGIVNHNAGGNILTIGNLSFAYTPSLNTITVSIQAFAQYYVSGMLVDFTVPADYPPLRFKEVKYFQNTTFIPATSYESITKPTPVFEISREESERGEYLGDFKFVDSSYYTYEFFITNMGIGQGVPPGQLETYSIKGNVDGYEQISMQCIFQKM